MTSDNGSNFIGSKTDLMELQQMYNELKSSDGIEMLVNKYDLRWKFSPARTPHFGGIWERAVRSMKLVLKKAMKEHQLTYDEFETCLCTTESILNSRPILPLDSLSPEGPSSLTARHFLIGRHLRIPPITSHENIKISHLKRWNLVQRLQPNIWKMFHTRYMQSLQARNKWKEKSVNLKIGDIVIVKDQSLAGKNWPLAIITNTFPGKDKLIRVVKIRCHGKTYLRGINQLTLLTSSADEPAPPPEDVQA